MTTPDAPARCQLAASEELYRALACMCVGYCVRDVVNALGSVLATAVILGADTLDDAVMQAESFGNTIAEEVRLNWKSYKAAARRRGHLS